MKLQNSLNNEITKLNRKLIINAKFEYYKRHYYEFFKAAVKVLEPETVWEFNWHIELACKMIQDEVHRVFKKQESEYQGMLFNLPPSSSKSMIFSICLVAWVWVHYPWAKIATNSYNTALATDHCMKARDLIKSDWYQEIFGHLYKLRKDTDTKTQFINNFGGERKVNAQTGKHFDIIIADDITNPKLVQSAAYRKQTEDLFFKVLPSRFRNLRFKSMIVVMQRLHVEDIVSRIHSKGLKYQSLIVPAEKLLNVIQPPEIIRNYTENSFWHSRFPISVLNDKKNELGSIEYMCQYNQTATKLEGNIFNVDWFKFTNINNIYQLIENSKKYTNRGTLINNQELIFDFIIDTAYGDKKDAGDYSAILCVTTFNNKLYVVNCVQVRKQFNDLISFIEKWVLNNNYTNSSRVYIENVAGGKYVRQVLSAETMLNVIAIDSKITSMGKKNRALKCIPICEAERVEIIKNGDYEDCIQQIANFNFEYDIHDDLLDCLMYAIQLKLSVKNNNKEYKIHFV